MKSVLKLKRMVVASMLAALCCVATMIVQVPSPTQGYMHLGDAMVLVSGWLLGSFWGALAAGIGSALADIFSGYALYAPITFVIKAAMAALSAIGYRLTVKWMSGLSVFARLISAVAAEIVMIIGYFAFEAAVIGYGWAALAGVPGNAVQGAFGLIVGTVVMHVLDRIHLADRF